MDDYKTWNAEYLRDFKMLAQRARPRMRKQLNAMVRVKKIVIIQPYQPDEGDEESVHVNAKPDPKLCRKNYKRFRGDKSPVEKATMWISCSKDNLYKITYASLKKKDLKLWVSKSAHIRLIFQEYCKHITEKDIDKKYHN